MPGRIYTFLLWFAAATLGFAASGCAVFRPNTLGGAASLPGQPLPANLSAAMRRDVGKLRVLHEELQTLLPAREEYLRGLCRAVEAEHRRLYRPDEEETMRGQFARALACRRELLELAARYAGHASVSRRGLRERAMLLHTAATMLSGLVETRLAENPCLGRANAWMVRRKLNEAVPDCGYPSGAYDMICQIASGAEGRQLRAKLSEELAGFRPVPRLGGQDKDPRWLRQVAAEARAGCEAGATKAEAAWNGVVLDSGAEAAHAPVYAVVELASIAIADADWPVRRCVTPEQIGEILQRLQPGDILFRRGFGRLTNQFIPGYWTHTMIYVGTGEELARRGARGDPPKASEGYVIETCSRGVVALSLREALDADSVLVLRPRLRRDQIDKALARAVAYLGAPFDYDFDFFTGDKLICSEVIYRAYGDLLDLRPGEQYGRPMMTAQDIVRAFTDARARQDRGLDFVLMLLGDEQTGQARPAEAEEIP